MVAQVNLYVVTLKCHTFDIILGHAAAKTAGEVAGDVGGGEK